MQDHTSQTPSPAAKRDGVSQTVSPASRRDENSVQTTERRMRLEARAVQTEAEFASETVMDDEIPVVMESLLVDDILEQEAGGAEAEIRAMMADAGWDASEILGVDELARLVRQNVSRTLEYARELELDTEFLRSQLESQLMRSEDADVLHQREIDRLDALLGSQIEMRKALQSSAVDLAEKTTQMWNKYGSRSKSLRSVLN